MPERPIEQSFRPEIEKRPEGKEKAQEIVNEMVDYVIELRNIRLDLQAGLNTLSVAPEGAREQARIEKLKENLSEIDAEIVKLDEFLKWAEEQGDKIEITS